jgi:hypothetical protein
MSFRATLEACNAVSMIEVASAACSLESAARFPGERINSELLTVAL